jgi:hypothetical protein
MDTRTLAYVGLGVLAGIVIATLIGVPPFIWIAAAIIALVSTVAVVVAQADGTRLADRTQAPQPDPAETERTTAAARPTRSSTVEIELVRDADETTAAPAVWLHRRGGRRVHRFETADGWVVQRVSTKDPDDPRKRVIGTSLVIQTEADAIRAADELAQGQNPASTAPKAGTLAVAKA